MRFLQSIAVLDSVNSTIEHTAPPEETIRRMLLGQRYSLFVYHTLEDKLQLLDNAISVGDGNIILTVIIFLKRTLKGNIFIYHISKRKIAVKHYVNYLIDRNNLQELADLYMATGNVSDLKDIYYIHNKDISNSSVLYKKIDNFLIEHNNVENKLEIQENLDFLKWLIENKCQHTSLIGQLIMLCKRACEKGNDDFAMDFKKKFKIDDFQYEWVVMSVLCRMKSWDKLVNMFVKNMWMLKKRTLKSTIRSDLFIISLGRYKAPSQVLEQFLPFAGDIHKSLYLAEKFAVHLYVIKYYIEQKDKGSLLKYMSKVEIDSDEMRIIHNAVNNPDINWKN